MNSTRLVRPLALIAGAIVLAVLTLLLGYRIGLSRHGSTKPAAGNTAAPAEADILYWYDPMKPEQHFDKPGKSPFMDMQLIPKRAGGASAGSVKIEPGVRQNLGIRTELVELGTGALADVVAPGTLQWDLRGERRISSRVEGFVDQVFVRAPYERVHAGQALASLQAPRLATAIAEYRALASAASPEARSVRAAAAARLRLLGLSEADARAGASPRVLLRAPADGVLAEILVRAGDNVAPGQAMFRLNATDEVWLDARLAQGSAAGIVPGMPVQVRVATFPGETFDGRVDLLLPELDPSTRTQAVRIVLDNRDGRLAAGMFADAVLKTSDDRRLPWIASEALIVSGRDARVIVADAADRFRAVRVRAGRQAAGRTEILEGLKGGERVVVSGQFLLDSEASLSGALHRVDPP